MLKQGFILKFVNACNKRALSTASEKVTLYSALFLNAKHVQIEAEITHVNQVVSRGCIIVPWLEVQNHSTTSRKLTLPRLYHMLDWCLKHVLAVL